MANTSVTILCQIFYPELISTGQTLTELAEELEGLGVEVKVICGPLTLVDRTSVPKRMEHRGIRIERVWSTQFPKLHTAGKFINLVTYFLSTLIKILFSRDKDPLLILTNPPFLALVGAFARWIRKRPYIFLVFDVYPDIAVNAGTLKRGGLIHRAWNLLNRILYQNASKVIVLGDRMAETVISDTKLYPRNRDRLEVIHIWCDDRNIAPSKPETSALKKEWGFTDKFILQYSGNIGRMHDIDTILEAATILKEDARIHFQFIGEGYKKGILQKEAARRGLGNCSFHAYVPREKLPDSLAAAGAGLVTLNEEFTGMAVPSKAFGIMAGGKPMLAIMDSRSEVAQIVQEYHCGFVIKPGDHEALVSAIRQIVDHPALAEELGNNGVRAIRESYSLHHAALRYREILNTCQSNG